jgi:hypothetical protein
MKKNANNMKQRKVTALAVAVAIGTWGIPGVGLASIEEDLHAMMQNVNGELEGLGVDYRVGMTEYYTAADEVGKTVFVKDIGNKQLSFHFVPGDPRRANWSGPVGPGDDITWDSDTVLGDAGPGLIPTQTAIGNAMSTWDGLKCSNLPLTGPGVGGDLGVVEYLVSGSTSGSPFTAADVVHAGFGTPVDAILPPPIIAATFTAFFIDVISGNPTDIDNDGTVDTAFREIYYTAHFTWGINTNLPIDVETVALHEVGHGLSQAHFGQLFRTDANGKFHFAPRAVMNAGYTGIQQQLRGTDKAGHCSIWASWPKK